ncbi:MAG: rhamnan synthesis F family protein [Verrucomicrobiota bacterium]
MKRLILFAHFDPEHRIRPYICHHLEGLHALGGEIHFISNSSLPISELDKIRPLVLHASVRENQGFDFSMWQAALKAVSLGDWDELLLTNSSIAGPFRPLQILFDRMAGQTCDFWGLTEHQFPTPHIQSYFMVFRKSALSSKAFQDFWTSVLPYRNKDGTIFAYEIGITLYLRDQGLTGRAAFQVQELQRNFLNDLIFKRKVCRWLLKRRNPSIYYPDLLIRAGMPYVKMEVLLKNPYNLRLSMVRKCIQARGYDLANCD